MSNFEDFRKLLTSLCEKAQHGSLSMEEFYAHWPQDLKDSEFGAVLYEAIEDGVEHFPGNWLTGKPDIETWEKEFTFFTLYLDHKLLLSKFSESEILNLHKTILRESPSSIDKIESRLTELSSS